MYSEYYTIAYETHATLLLRQCQLHDGSHKFLSLTYHDKITLLSFKFNI